MNFKSSFCNINIKISIPIGNEIFMSRVQMKSQLLILFVSSFVLMGRLTAMGDPKKGLRPPQEQTELEEEAFRDALKDFEKEEALQELRKLLTQAELQVQYLKRLTKNGTDLNARDNEGDSALMWAVRCGKKEIAQLLLNAGADVNARNDNGYTVLMEVAGLGKEEIARQLINAGADVNARFYNGTTALMRAVLRGRKEIAQLLVDAGAHVNARNNDGKIALTFAIAFNYLPLVELLLENGADSRIRDNAGRTALDIATQNGNQEIIQLLQYFQKKKLM